MYDSLLYHFNVIMIGDTAILNNAVADSNALQNIVQENFLQINTVQINPILLAQNNNFDIITYTIIALLVFVSAIWYMFPEKFATIISLKSTNKIHRDGDSILKSPGKIITSLFWLNFLLTLSIFIFLILKETFTERLIGISDYEIFGYIILTLCVLFLYRFVLIFGSAIIFQTQTLMKQQLLIDRNIQLITGLLLLPVILLIMYTTIGFLLYFIIGLMIFLQVYRLLQIVLIGKSSTVFSALHIILYLCTLEIVPILVLFRLINNDSVV